MIEVVVNENKLILVAPFLRNHTACEIEIPLKKVAGAEIDFSLARGWLQRLNFLADFVPSLKREGVFYEDANCVYWEVSDANRTIVIHLQDEPHEKLIVEVENPIQAIEIIKLALKNKVPEISEINESTNNLN